MAVGRRPLFGEQQRFMLFLIAPAALLLVLFQVLPIAIGANASFRDWALYNPEEDLGRPRPLPAVITDPAFLEVVLPNTFIFMVLSVAGALVAGPRAGAAAQPAVPRPEDRADRAAGAADGGAGDRRHHDALDVQRPVRDRERRARGAGAGGPAVAGRALERLRRHRADRHLAVDAVVHPAAAGRPAEPAAASRSRPPRSTAPRPGACSAISPCRCCGR